MAALPVDFDLPSLWADGQAAAACLEGTPLGEAAAAKKRWLQALSTALPPSLRQVGLDALADALESKEVDLNAAIGWADACVWSRGVGVPVAATRPGEQRRPPGAITVAEGDVQISLLPGLDMCNHHGSVEEAEVAAAWHPRDDGGIELWRMRHDRTTAAQDADGAAAREVTISYGSKPGEELLFLYGFFPRANPDDVALLRLRLLPPLTASPPAPPDARSQEEAQRLQALQLSLLETFGEDQLNIQDGGDLVVGGAVQLPQTLDIGTGEEDAEVGRRPAPALQAVLNLMRVYALTAADCFHGMAPAKLGAWLDVGGGKFSQAVDLRALALLRGLALTELAQLQPVEATRQAGLAVDKVLQTAAEEGQCADIRLKQTFEKQMPVSNQVQSGRQR